MFTRKLRRKIAKWCVRLTVVHFDWNVISNNMIVCISYFQDEMWHFLAQSFQMLKAAKKKKASHGGTTKDTIVRSCNCCICLLCVVLTSVLFCSEWQEDHEQLLVGLVKEVLRRFPQMYVFIFFTSSYILDAFPSTHLTPLFPLQPRGREQHDDDQGQPTPCAARVCRVSASLCVGDGILGAVAVHAQRHRHPCVGRENVSVDRQS